MQFYGANYVDKAAILLILLTVHIIKSYSLFRQMWYKSPMKWQRKSQKSYVNVSARRKIKKYFLAMMTSFK